MAVYTEDAAGKQAAHPTDNSGEIHPRRKVVVVESAPLPRIYYRGPKRGGTFPIWSDSEDWASRVELATR